MAEPIDLGKLLCDLVDVQSVTGNESAIIRFLEEMLRELGASIRRFPMEGDRYNLLATIGKGRPVLCLNAHADTMPPCGSSVAKSCSNGGLIRGLGSCDDKASIASMLGAFSSAVDDGLSGRLDLLISVDEEVSSRGVRSCVEAGYRCDFAVVGEPTGLAPVVAHGGLIFLDLATKGTGGHGSSPWTGRNAIVSMVFLYRDLDALVSSFPSHGLVGRPSTNLGFIKGGDSTNRIPESCQAGVDVRVMPGTRVEDVLRAIERMFAGREATFSVFKKGDPMEAVRGSKLLEAVDKAQQDVLGVLIEPRGFRGWTEADPLRNIAGADVLVMGPGQIAQAHSPEEYVELEQVQRACEIYTHLVRQLVGGGAS